MSERTRSSNAADLTGASSVEELAGVGPARAKLFRQLGVARLAELLDYFPRDYQQELAEAPIAELTPGAVQSARGEVVAVDYISHPRARFEATLEDSSGKLALVWFNGAYLRSRLHPGLNIRVRGKIASFRNYPQMAQPKWEIVDDDDAVNASSRLQPIYAASANLPTDAIANVIDQNLDAALPTIIEWLPEELLRKRSLNPLTEAYRAIHRPNSRREAQGARRRFVYDELLLLQLGLGLGKRAREGRISAPVFRIDRLLDERITARFPFTLTDAQRRAVFDIVNDLRSGRPMNRLLQGDVGSGKTVVALYAMLAAVANKMQAAILAPTEVLAEQHYLTLGNLLRDSKVRIELFTQRTKRKSKSNALKALSAGEVHLAIGTQALIQRDVEFANLGLVVVDEQHKLGVRQRAVLREKGYSPHYLVMTATPIPRTLALSYFADFDLTTIDELPPGRQPIPTRLVRAGKALQAYEFVREEVAKGRQAYVVLPQIDDTGLDDSRSVVKEFDRLSKGPLSGLRLGMLHGQMPAEEKQEVMSRFRDGQIDVLVATTVIEVGIDVPNATVMVIVSAERFGLSQLHQLRGRVGRGEHASHCLLLSDANNADAEERLDAMTRTNNGFEIAEMDMRLRGPGEFFGTRQHGLPPMKMADLSSDLELLELARDDAIEMLADDPRLTSKRNAPIRAALLDRFGEHLELVQVG